MGRYSKFSPEFKLKCVQEFIDGDSAIQISQRYNIPGNSTVKDWYQKYRIAGATGLVTSPQNKIYPSEFKQKVILEYYSGNLSLSQLCIKYQISSVSVLRCWLKADNISPDNGETEMADQKKKKHTAKKFTEEQKGEAVKWCLENNRNYQETADRFGCSYTQIYTWVKKVSQQGLQALEDRRGKRRPEADLTSEERSARRIKQLEAENELLRRENLLLKKLEQIERKW